MRNINVDLTRIKGKHDKFFKVCAGTGRAYLLLRSDHQQHLEIARRECGFEYLRFHGLLDDDMGVYREDKDGNPVYNWQYVDSVYDYILSIGMRPFLEFSFMPGKLASGNKTVYWEQSNITPPKDYAKWRKLIYEVVKHFTERYGCEEVKKWYFEVWNEPDLFCREDHYNEGTVLFFTGDMNEYFILYESTARAVKSVCHEYRVGGPAFSGVSKDNWIGGLIDYCYDNKVPIDFVTTHGYLTKFVTDEGNVGGTYFDKEGNCIVEGKMYYDPESVVGDVKRACNEVKASCIPNLDIYFTEFGLSCDYWDPLRDSYHAASYILSRLKRDQGCVKAMTYYIISDVFEEDGPPTDHFHGGFGLLNLQSIRKPSFFAYKYLNQLGDMELECNDPDTFACFDERGIQVLFWDCTVRQDLPNKEYYNRDIPSLLAQKVRLTITGLKLGTYEVSFYCTGYRHNDAYTSFLEMMYSGSLTREQVKSLDNQSSDLPVKNDKIVITDSSSGIFECDIDMRENDVYLVTLVIEGGGSR